MQLSKKDKKKAREIIEKGLEKEFSKGLLDADSILFEWKNKQIDNRSAYHSLYKSITSFDAHIARRYDGMTGSKYIYIVTQQLGEELISKEDLEGLSPEVTGAITFMSGTEK